MPPVPSIGVAGLLAAKAIVIPGELHAESIRALDPGQPQRFIALQQVARD
jgi:hypothetical protein